VARAVSGAALVATIGFPLIGLEHDRTIGLFDPDSPASGCVARRQRITADLVDVVTAWLRGSDCRLELLESVDVGDGLLAVAADSEHGLNL
jgi:hypothetical protein